jgi:phage replication-related protein YjqB (UPF0714/DUF867 family)
VLAELLALPGVDERLTLRSQVGFCALHGGLEAATAEIAAAAAQQAGASYYAVVQPDDLHWHVPSHRYAPAQSNALRQFLDHVEIIISVHGFGGVRDADDRWTTALLGGSNRLLAQSMRDALTAALPGYRWIGDLDAIPSHLRGVHPANPVNLASNGGVQLELPPRVRRPGADYDALVTTLASTARDEPRRYSGAARPAAPASPQLR